jgi:hypothetical protein
VLPLFASVPSNKRGRYTSVAFTCSTSPAEVKLVETWPNDSPGLSSAEQVPTQVAYEGPIIRWGYEVSNSRRSSEPLMFLNLLLEQSVADGQALRTTPLRASTNFRASQSDAHGGTSESPGLEERVGSTRLQQRLNPSVVTEPSVPSPPSCALEPRPFMSQLRKNRLILADRNISALTAVADFLSKVRETTLLAIERSFATEWVGAQKVKWILTVPGRWDDSAKERMAQAARQAGFGEREVDFELVSEPECVATYTQMVIPYCLSVGTSSPRSPNRAG